MNKLLILFFFMGCSMCPVKAQIYLGWSQESILADMAKSYTHYKLVEKNGVNGATCLSYKYDPALVKNKVNISYFFTKVGDRVICTEIEKNESVEKMEEVIVILNAFYVNAGKFTWFDENATRKITLEVDKPFIKTYFKLLSEE